MIRVYVTEEQRRFNERRDKLNESYTNDNGGDDWDDDHSTIGVGLWKGEPISIRRSKMN